MLWTGNVLFVFGVLIVSVRSASCEEQSLSTTPVPESLADSPVDYSDEPEQCDKKFMCYFPSWGANRVNGTAYTIDTLNTSLCTHYIYAFAMLDGVTYEAAPSHPEVDIEKDYLKKFCEKVKAAGAIPLLAVGGWGDGENGSYEELFKDTAKQDKFIASVITMLNTYGFEGLELDYEYPGCPMGNCTEPEAKNRFTDFVKRIHKAFAPEPTWTISMAIPAGYKFLDYGFDLAALEKYTNWFSVMCYDYFDVTTNITHLHSPKVPQPNSPKEYNVDYTIKYIRNSGVSPESIILGMPMYGKGYTLKDPNQHTINSPTTGPMKPVPVPAFYEICKMIKEGWKMETQYKGKYYGRWLYNDDQWVGFDGIPELRLKTNMIASQNLGGGMIWALDLDDFRGECGRGISPLTTFLSEQILGNCKS